MTDLTITNMIKNDFFLYIKIYFLLFKLSLSISIGDTLLVKNFVVRRDQKGAIILTKRLN